MKNTHVMIMAGVVVFVLLLVKQTTPAPQVIGNAWEHPIKGNALPTEPLKKSVRMAMNPSIELDFKSKEEIYKIRKQYVRQYRELAPENYEPSEVIFGEIVGGKAWWGEEGLAYYGKGVKMIAGKSEESTHLVNPYLLVGLDPVLINTCKSFFPSKPMEPHPLEMIWEKRNLAHVYYDVTSYRQMIKRCNKNPIWVRELLLISYNAKDFGYNYLGVDLEKSENIGFLGAARIPALIKHFIHLATNCEYPGGCNNASPSQPELNMPIMKLPAKAHIKLWKEKPDSMDAPADFTFMIYMI